MQDKSDPLYAWKKHSGFKKGLLTDIVLGDQPSSHGQYDTTMQRDYLPKILQKNIKFAGRSSSDKETKHIVFGDVKLPQEVVSMTGTAFKKPVVTKEVTSIIR